MATMMKRWSIDSFGREHLRLQTVPIPEPKRGEVLVEVRAVSLNHRDLMMVENGMGSPVDFPFSPGSDLCGVVVARGEGASRFQIGDRAISNFLPGWIDGRTGGNARVPDYRALGGELPGVMAEYVAFPEDWLTKAPASLDDGQASTLPVAGLTAWFSLVERGALRAGQTVVVQGTGGVALFGLQIARMHGATVIVTSGSDEKLGRATALGATHVINRHTEDWVEAVYRHTGDRGADHVLELVGGDNLGRSVEAVAVGGQIYVIGLLDGLRVSAPAVPLILKSPVLHGVAVGHRRALEDFCAAIDRTQLEPVIQQRFAFDELPAALDAMNRGPFGKIILELVASAA